MQSQDAASRPAPSADAPGTDDPPAAVAPRVGVDQAEAALVEHYPRLVRLAHLVLPPGMGRTRRVLTAHALVQRALPGRRTPAPAIPAQSAGRAADPGYALVRLRVVRTALEAGLPLRRPAWPRRSQLPPLLPAVWGLRVFPRPGGADELALDRALAALTGPGRAAYALRGLERLPDDAVRRVLTEAGAADPAGALAEAGSVPGGPARYALLAAAEFDPCSLQVRPTDLMRRRTRLRAALAGGAVLVAGAMLLGPPGGDRDGDGPAAPPYARNAAAQAALDPARLVRVSPTAWLTSARTDFSVWPARGDRVGDRELLRRALAVWARPGERVRVAATPGTPAGGPAGPPHLLYAGTVDAARVVLLYDGLRVVRYAEPEDSSAGAALDLARTDGAGRADATAVVLGRTDGNVRYLTAPWVTKAAGRDLTEPDADATGLALTDGVTAPLAGPVPRSGDCASWTVLELTDDGTARLLSDLGELVPARLTAGPPGAAKEVSGARARHAWAPYACSLGAVRGQGVRSVNAWEFAKQPLPHATGTARWVCTRAETWRGTGARVLAQFHTPGGRYGAVAAKATDVPACGGRAPEVLAGVLWKSKKHGWYLLAAGSEGTASVRASGGIDAAADGRVLAARAGQGARAGLTAELADGRTVRGLR
ncbi:hypothetical protein [Streptomyces daghestanicus]|uniref:DNA-directed RNA polymerase specialized sigma24 family protein n=1 Tax=Streptomyces daghestanicus TaxID=66885 RepID=A0ABQ3QBD1_9ACTN|nr:hypothetical protein [Streptomyces daghestanicus]GGU37652.1 hypothetical protein GCM10010259_30400 [Streptomyces daghestanicus]GHI34606.1 hypothetical protein Sdagh_63360 [Streptomyces daghestanicus]